MEKRQQEIYDDIIKRRGPLNPLTKSQKKHLKHVAKKRVRSEKRKEKQLREQEESGKLIEENHNGGEYSPEFTEKAASWLLQEILDRLGMTPDQFFRYFLSRKAMFLRLVLKWNAIYPKDQRYSFFKGILEYYWDTRPTSENLLIYAKSNLGCP